jgi:hypothetical protein
MLIFGIAPEPLGTRMSRYFLESGVTGNRPETASWEPFGRISLRWSPTTVAYNCSAERRRAAAMTEALAVACFHAFTFQ